jgi:predicted house-cleaning NTP pyrophosphatase (Maf/HAM1 superfamily)
VSDAEKSRKILAGKKVLHVWPSMQVCHNCLADPEALGEMEQQAQQAAAAASAEQALVAAFAGLLCDDSKLLQKPAAEAGGLTVLYEVRGAVKHSHCMNHGVALACDDTEMVARLAAHLCIR